MPEPRVELALARADLLVGNPAGSMRRISAYLDESGDSGIALLEEARALASMGSLDSAAVTYLAGAQVASIAVKDAYQLDIDWVASPDELARYDRLSTDSIGVFITAFWSARDLQELRPRGSQVREHLRRWVYVKQRFLPPDLGYRALFLPYGVTSCRQPAEPSASPEVASTPRQGYSAVPQLFDSRAVLYMPVWRVDASRRQ